ncbi:MAG: SDR family oxidoreductase [Planctomycetaceae bacterium]|jgi:dTDP-4-dehydrorhamnose reductase|nr:SDR family oxidoreductase [Planctomycetaceae bacterium]
MIRVLILGGTGMLGHKLVQLFSNRFETWTTTRSSFSYLEKFGLFDENRTITGVDIKNIDTIISVLGKVKPDIVINCVGIIKQHEDAYDPITCLKINSLFPHQLSNLCHTIDSKLIHIGTDCVFSGKKGDYTEKDISDAEDLYGKTKFLGEITGMENLTLRTSIIGRELTSTQSLIDWFLSNRGKRVRGFSRAIYSGFTTHQFAQILGDVIEYHPQLSGLFHVSSEPISKFELLKLVNQFYHAGITIDEETEFLCNRNLDSSFFRHRTGFIPPTWETMIEEMAADTTPYDSWHNK